MLQRLRNLFLGAAFVLLGGWALLPQPAPDDGRVQIDYWEKWGGFEADAMRDVVDAFNARQDRIRVNYLPVSQVDQKMLLATAGGNPPDLVGLWSWNVYVFSDYGALRPLDDLIERDGIDPGRYQPPYWELTQHRGRAWALPTAPATVALHWNKQHFREAGLDPDRPPRTLSELDEFAERLTVREGGRLRRMGFLPPEPGWWNWGWGYFFGGDLWDGAGRVTPDAPENVEAFRWVQSYAQKYGREAVGAFQSGFGPFNSPQNAFISGQVSMVLQGVWMANFINSNNPELEWDAAPFPYPDHRPDLAETSVVDMDVLAIPTGARHVEEAWEFIKFAQTHAGMELLGMGQWKHTPLETMTPEFREQHPNPRLELFHERGRGRTFSQPRIGIWREYLAELNSAFEDIWNNAVPPETALRRVRLRMQPKLDQELERARRRGWDADPPEAPR